MSFSFFGKDRTTGDVSASRGRRFFAVFAGIFGGRGKNAAYSRASLPVFFIGGVLAGFCICLLLKGMLISFSADAQKVTAAAAARRTPSFAVAGASVGLASFTDADPFGADVRAGGKSEQKSPLSDLSLKGTLPNIGAWISAPDGTHLYLKGQDVSGYQLREIRYGEAVLHDGKEKHSLFLTLSGGSSAKTPAPARQAPPKPERRSQQARPKLDFSGIEAASADKEGAIPRELVDALLMNPYDELKKMRLIPADDGSGMLLQRMDKDSVFAHVGVAPGDVIQAVNGVNITNMGEAANAVNSLMAGSRFDVSVLRNGKQVDLKYQVK
ncbi:MAG: PDZ domain-containing protein [Synergistes sp.]|nr:PDZ domain-containing protein [Synergistes sp.]